MRLPEAAAGLVRRWVRLYARGVPDDQAQRRHEEIAADLEAHVADERDHGRSDRVIAIALLLRAARGAAADVSWRRQRAVRHRSTRWILIGSAGLLAIPAVAMAFSEEVLWTPVDFAVAGFLLSGSACGLRALLRRARTPLHAAAVSLAVFASLSLVWVSLAVGVIGADGDPADLMYAGVFAAGLLVAASARRPGGLARGLTAMVAAQCVVIAVAIVLGRHQAPGSSIGELLGVNAFFAAQFLAAACLHRLADRRAPA